MMSTLKQKTQNDVGTFYFIKRFFLLTLYIFMWNFFGYFFVNQKMVMKTTFYLVSSN